MSGTCLIKLPHKTDKCNSSDGLQVFENHDGGLSGFCFACRTYVPHPLGEEAKPSDIAASKKPAKTKEEILAEMEFISTLPTVELPQRKLGKTTLEDFGIKIGLSEEDGTTPTFAYFPYTRDGEVVRWKVKHLPTGKCWSIGVDNNVDLFGWERAKAQGTKRLIIVEGEFDAPALTKILRMHTKDGYEIPAICSVPNGAGCARRDIARLLPEIRKHFRDITLCFDNDKAGQEAVTEVCTIAPEFKSILLPDKDANDCLKNGLGKAAFKAVTFLAEKAKNTRLVWGQDIHEAARKPAEWGLSWPWKHVTQATKGLRWGETIYIGAAPKMGKSELVNEIAAHFIEVHGVPVFVAKPEEANNKTYKMVAGKIACRKFHDPEVEFDEKAYDEAGKVMEGKLAMVNLYQHLGYETLKADIYTAAAAGCRVVFIDPITNLVNGLASAEQNTKLQEIAQDLAAIALDLNIIIFIFCHLRNPDSGEPHERGGKVLSSQFAGSRAMARSCNLMFGLEGNRDPDLPKEERNLRWLVLLEDREFGNAGRYGLYWDDVTTKFNEVAG